jgi:hypothetical protein
MEDLQDLPEIEAQVHVLSKDDVLIFEDRVDEKEAFQWCLHHRIENCSPYRSS